MDLNRILSVETFKQLGKDNAKKETRNFKTQNGSCRKRYETLGDIKTQSLEKKNPSKNLKRFQMEQFSDQNKNEAPSRH